MVKNFTKYVSIDKKQKSIARNYNKTAYALYRYLAYRDLSEIISQYVIGKFALDYEPIQLNLRAKNKSPPR